MHAPTLLMVSVNQKTREGSKVKQLFWGQGMKTKLLQYNERVRMHSTTDSLLDGQTGTLIGTSSVFPESTFWIVELDNPQPNRRAIVLTDACLESIGVEE